MSNEAWRGWIDNVNRDSDRRSVLNVLYGVAQIWQNSLPDLSSLPVGLIECFLSHAVTDQEGDEEARIRFIKFVVDTGYRDQPKVDTDGQYVLHRTTPIHLVLRTKIDNWDATATNMVQLLFEIYDKFDLNYTDEGGLTHFQAACFIPNGRQLVRKFLQNGQNPNIFVKGYTLLRSALQNDTEWAAELLTNGADPTWLDDDGSTALHTICRHDRVELLQSFFEVVDYHRMPVQVNVRDSLGNTPLQLAVENGFLKSSEILLRRGADPNSTNKEGSTPLHTICRRTNRDGLILEFFRTNDENRQTVQVNVHDSLGNTPLHLALENGNLWVASILLKRGADVNSVNEEGSTPLHIICRMVDVDKLIESFFKVTIENRQTVLVNVHDRKGNTPLHLAVESGNVMTSEILLERGADANSVNEEGSTPLHIICRKIQADHLLEKFFTTNARLGNLVQINARDKGQNTPLHLAILHSKKKASEMLLSRGADPNLADKDGCTALHLYLSKIHQLETFRTNNSIKIFFEICDSVKKTVKIDARDNEDRTPLYAALEYKNSKAVELLLKRGANPDLANKNGSTPLHLICQRNKTTEYLVEFMRILHTIGKSVNIHARDKTGRTPLSVALLNGNTKMAEWLLKTGADPNLADNTGWTPLHIICARCNRFLKTFLKIYEGREPPLDFNAKTIEGRTPLELLREYMPINYKKYSPYFKKLGARLD
ncbi:hypothetical protein TKK_0004078 [Trichogramma kaykai]|uniref:Uncharacterized protein n=1 Tax=Trichogramma kaykai TaxID=54128 RepID=A0ABD2XKT5_9HYME